MKIILPFYGEFGFFIRRYVLWVNHKFKEDDIMVCCRKGQECLFPYVVKFYYDWDDVDDSIKGKGMKLENYYDEDLISVLEKTYPESEIIRKKPPTIDYHKVKVSVKSYDYPKVDVVIGTRKRNLGQGKNFNHWQIVVDYLKEKGLTIGILGLKGTTFVPENVDVVSYDIANTTECIMGMMQNASIILNTDSGLAHLCRLLGLRQTVISVVGQGGGPGQMKYLRDNDNPDNLNEVSEDAFRKPNILLKSIGRFYFGDK
jgi:hypothetical protein